MVSWSSVVMRRLLRFSGFVAACAALSVVPLGAQAADPADLLRDLDKKIQEASVVGDVELLERHLADDFAFTHFGGGRDDKAHWVRLARLAPRPYLRRAVSEQQVELHGDVALVLGRLDVQTRPAQAGAATPASARPSCYALRYIHAYARRGEHWLFLSHDTTAMVEDAHPCQ
jgi:ketosteroid isomerase-like protein